MVANSFTSLFGADILTRAESPEAFHLIHLFYEIYKERNLRCVFLMQNIISAKNVNGLGFGVKSSEFKNRI